MKETLLILVVFLSLALCTVVPRVLVAQEAVQNELIKHISSWAEVKYVPVQDILSNGGDVEAMVVDGSLYAKHSYDLQAVLMLNDAPLIIMDMSSDEKAMMTEQLTFGTTGPSYIYSILPFTDRNRVRHHRIIDVPVRGDSSAVRMSVDESGQRSSVGSITFETNLDESARMFSDELFASITKGVFDPPANLTPPAGALYAILPYSIFGTYNVDLSDMGKSGTQTVTHRLDNNFYNYRENGYSEDGYYTVLLQDGIVNPGSLIISDPTQAIGFYQSLFTVSNQPYPFGAAPDGSLFYWAQSSPATVDQTISVTNSVSETLSLEIDMDVNGPSSKISTTWTASASVTSEIEQWGIVEDTNPANSSTSWTYHQQLPYDPFELGWSNFGNWYTSAYSGNNVAMLPDLSTNTLQVHTISAWYASGSLRQNGSIPVQTTSNRNHQVAIICDPSFYNGHHHAEVWHDTFSDAFKMDLNQFPNNTISN